MMTTKKNSIDTNDYLIFVQALLFTYKYTIQLFFCFYTDVNGTTNKRSNAQSRTHERKV